MRPESEEGEEQSGEEDDDPAVARQPFPPG
jgi:hypothetical protein